MRRCVNEAGIGFMMSPIYHPAMKIVRPVRSKLKVKTVFNILGPMLNPARVPFAVVGVYKEELVSGFIHLVSLHVVFCYIDDNKLNSVISSKLVVISIKTVIL